MTESNEAKARYRSFTSVKVLVMINLGLARISQLLRNTALPWRAIHIAGTNGKGSVCAYISAMLKAANVPCGRFTSPHLIDRWDCITINEKAIDKDLFTAAEQEVQQMNADEGIGASEFELLTATAFTLFSQQKIDFGVVEVGMGGTEDATNILRQPAVTVITKIGEDHQSFLGKTLEEITEHKAGILKPGVTCVVDGSNDKKVLSKIRERAIDRRAGSVVCVPDDRPQNESIIWSVLRKDDYEIHQQMHVSLAFEALCVGLGSSYSAQDLSQLLRAVRSTFWPGRLQNINIKALTSRTEDVLLDGAHNKQAADVLRSYVDRRLRQGNKSVTWVIAVSKGKPVHELLAVLLQPQDSLVASEFGAVSGMPWVSPVGAGEITSAAKEVGLQSNMVHSKLDIVEALNLATGLSFGGPVVVAGSLYLVSDVLRAIRASSENSV